MEIEVYPNPFTYNITIRVDNFLKEDLEIEIYNLLGIIVTSIH